MASRRFTPPTGLAARTAEQPSERPPSPADSKGAGLKLILATERETLDLEAQADAARARLTSLVRLWLERFGERTERVLEDGTREISWRHVAFALPSGEVVQPVLHRSSRGTESGYLRHLTTGEVIDPE